jgi:hypothetical protein
MEDCFVSHICRSCFHSRQEVLLWHQVCQVACSKFTIVLRVYIVV